MSTPAATSPVPSSDSAFRTSHSAFTSLPLPPTSRDFEIHRLSLIELVSQRRLAELFEISQTRVRQIIAEVSRWLAQQLPIPTEAELEREKRLAIHLAAAQLQHQIEQLQIFWQQTSDPKYLRQQTRAILALARLGVTPGALDEISSRHTPCADQSEHTTFGPPQDCWNVKPETLASPTQNSAFSPQPSPCPPPPPRRDCSPNPDSPSAPSPNAADPIAETPTSATTWDDDPNFLTTQSEGLTFMENRLLTLLGNTADSDHDRRQSLEDTLSRVRKEKAAIVLKLTPHQPLATST